MKDPVTMRILHREVNSYRDDNERVMKALEEIIQRLNILHKKLNKDSHTKKVSSARQVTTYIYER